MVQPKQKPVRWFIEVKVRVGDRYEWRKCRPSSAVVPYVWETEEEADYVMRMSYPDRVRGEEVRLVCA